MRTQTTHPLAPILAFAFVLAPVILIFALGKGTQRTTYTPPTETSATSFSPTQIVEQFQRETGLTNQEVDQYALEFIRHQQLGEKKHPTRQEIQEYLELDARLSVKEGLMTESDFEDYTGQEY